jgi:hypothetical protein
VLGHLGRQQVERADDLSILGKERVVTRGHAHQRGIKDRLAIHAVHAIARRIAHVRGDEFGDGGQVSGRIGRGTV